MDENKYEPQMLLFLVLEDLVIDKRSEMTDVVVSLQGSRLNRAV